MTKSKLSAILPLLAFLGGCTSMVMLTIFPAGIQQVKGMNVIEAGSGGKGSGDSNHQSTWSPCVYEMPKI